MRHERSSDESQPCRFGADRVERTALPPRLVISNGRIQEGASVLRELNESLDPNGLII